ncbi:ATP-binding cassette domain-containing protein [Nonomuraea sp. MCN248]|uniref:ATP-binding cassette domain-containing protein n=1 Tax=Nonomuraea corallina TaxID=2989783 RepID=A0ABT4SMQ1_9ACTN|nr:ATP-binding cassette domain-containing protein [Nonomuraea corallina]MDA0638389.1 ATP-binding cassette domain-containing protein [Nonomuraea corallina]
MIEVSGLTKTYGSTRAVNDLSFEVRPGVVTGFLGPNGAGKTTTMRLILGLDRPTAGAATIGGKPYRRLGAPLHTVGSMLDAKAVHPGRTAYNHLLSLALGNGIPRRRVDEVIEQVGLGSVARRRTGGFSLGMSQRLGIAGALLGDPQVLLFDEPVNGLDPEGIHWVRSLMRDLAARGRTVFVSSHLLSEMSQTAERLIVIGRGELIADTTTEEFIERASTGYVRVRGPEPGRVKEVLEAAGATVAESGHALHVTGMTVERISDLAAEHGLRLHEVAPQHASLEEAFLTLTRQSVEYHARSEGER